MGITTNDLSSGSLAGGTLGSSLTWSHTVSAGSNKILVVAITREAATGIPTINSVTFNGVGMTVANSVSADEGPFVVSSIYYLLNPAETTANIVITTSTNNNKIAAVACTLQGAKQQAPEVTNTGSTTTDGGSFSTNITTLSANALVLDAFCTNNIDVPTVANGQTVVGSKSSGTTGDTIVILGKKEIASPGANTFGWSVSPNFQRCAQVLASFEVAAAALPPIPLSFAHMLLR